MFKNFQSAAVLTGSIAGVIYTIDAAGSRFESNALQGAASMLAGPFLLLSTSAIGYRSFSRLIVAALFTFPAIFIISFMGMFFLINGRAELPLVVWSAPYQAIAVPGGTYSWHIPALFQFLLFWAVLNSMQLYLRHGKLWPNKGSRIALFGPVIALSLLVPAVLYPVSWVAKVSGTFTYALYTPAEGYFSLAAYFSIFPITNWWLHAIADRKYGIPVDKIPVHSGDTNSSALTDQHV